MPKWISTEWNHIYFGWDFKDKTDRGFFTSVHKGNLFFMETPYPTLDSALQSLTEWATRNQYEIKASIPLTTSMGEYNAVWWKGNGGYGYGYGVSQITGMAVLVQREEEVSQEEYDRRLAAQKKRYQLEKNLPDLRRQCEKLQKDVQYYASVASEDITEKKKLIGGAVYLLGSLEFSSRAEAQAKLDEITAKRAEMQQAQAALMEAERAIESLK